MMTVAEQVKTFLDQNFTGGLCDDCIARELMVKRRQQVAPVTLTLGIGGEFVRTKRECPVCGREKLVIGRS